ncbi:MAG: anti-sigma factor family protein [Terriglobia bacterium]
MNEHEKTRQQLPGLLSGTLSSAQEASVRAHLASCQACARQERVWQALARSIERMPETLPTPARLARIRALAEAHRQAVLERRWNRLVLTGLVVQGWALFLVSWPLLPRTIEWLTGQLGLPWFATALLGLGLWWSFCWAIGLALLPLVRGRKPDLEEKVV